MRISDWSSDVCSSDLLHQFPHGPNVGAIMSELGPSHHATSFGSASSDRSRMAISSLVAVRLFAIARSFNRAFKSAERRMSFRVLAFISTEERRVGKECVVRCRLWGSGYHENKKRK